MCVFRIHSFNVEAMELRHAFKLKSVRSSASFQSIDVSALLRSDFKHALKEEAVI